MNWFPGRTKYATVELTHRKGGAFGHESGGDFGYESAILDVKGIGKRKLQSSAPQSMAITTSATPSRHMVEPSSQPPPMARLPLLT
jgi:hypothetical protein